MYMGIKKMVEFLTKPGNLQELHFLRNLSIFSWECASVIIKKESRWFINVLQTQSFKFSETNITNKKKAFIFKNMKRKTCKYMHQGIKPFCIKCQKYFSDIISSKILQKFKKCFKDKHKPMCVNHFSIFLIKCFIEMQGIK